ncbi:hypothetical protein [Mycobacteroides abscessus]|uniref:hypothetical protein n=1 Tax=Mycobacteroides abscessus TaxID=36809 RepID=UPI0009A55EE5|nr:hypothetical protein [Mycobacteroides abscessus]SKQ12609.1 Uncharacterised protein [Mycobacteroides abscessus subsp. massiliense]
MTASAWAADVPALLTLLGVVAGALIGRAHGRKQAEAAISQAETADWAAYSSELRQDRDEAHRQVRIMQGDIQKLSVRVDAAEERADAADTGTEQRSDTSNSCSSGYPTGCRGEPATATA